jgi:demethoxyubiquinone hydroxylase (CLK1/Coq7/Cat5 family)
VKAPEDHQSLEVGIDSVVAAERFVAQINDAERKSFFRHNDHEKAFLKSCRPRIRNRGTRKSLFIIAKIFKSKKFLVVTAVVKMKIPTIHTKQN